MDILNYCITFKDSDIPHVLIGIWCVFYIIVLKIPIV